MRRRQKGICRAGLLLVMGLLSPLLMASNDDAQQPIHIEADRADIDEPHGVMNYSGHVVLRQGSIEVLADSVVVYSKEGELQRIIAQGQPVHYRQQSTDAEAGAAAAPVHPKR